MHIYLFYQTGVLSFPKELADVFAEDSENDRTFYGFSEGEINDHKVLKNETLSLVFKCDMHVLWLQFVYHTI